MEAFQESLAGPGLSKLSPGRMKMRKLNTELFVTRLGKERGALKDRVLLPKI
jgi:hypothetical protein